MGSFKAQRGGGLIIGFLLSKTIQKSSSTVKDDVKMFSHIRNDWMTSRVLEFKYCIFWFLPTIILKTGSLLYIGSLFHVKPWPSNTDLEFHPKVVGFRVNSKFHIVCLRIWSQRAIKMLSLSRKKLAILQKNVVVASCPRVGWAHALVYFSLNLGAKTTMI